MWTLLLSKINQPGVYIDRRQVDGGELRIGRSADKADWVIADPDGHLSRHHCTVAAIGLDLFVIDTSTNGVALNHAASRVAPQQPVPIRVRDRLLLGDYAIEIATEGAGAGISLQPPPPVSSGFAELTQPDAWFDGGGIDPIWGVGAPKAEVHEFLGDALHDFLGGTPAAAYSPAADPWAGPMSDAFSKPILAPMQPMPDAFGIPEDWAAPPAPAGAGVPFGSVSPSHPPAMPQHQAPPWPPVPDRRDGDVFAPAAAGDPFAPAPAGSDPFATPAADPFAIPGTAQPDPFAGFGPAADGGHFGDPFAHPAAPGADPFANAPPIDPFAAPAMPADPFAERLPPPAIDPFADFPPTTDAMARFAEPPAQAAPVAAAPPPAAPPPRNAATDAAAWAAFCEGAGLTPEEMRGSPDAMRRLGTLYRQVVLGLSDLIQDRAAFKDEFRVERTQLSFGRNNPLKHLPALESAKLLLGDPLPGFMPADDAVRSAFEDVKKHQLAMLAGVQHALTAVFERLAPAEIERIMNKAAATRKGLPFGRGVNPWTVYQTVFDALRMDASSNVNSVMSVAFREGYEAFLKKAQ